MLVLLPAILLLWGAERTEGVCPHYKDISPCTCKSLLREIGVEFSILSCDGVNSGLELTRALRASVDADILELELTNANLERFPRDAFAGNKFQIISLRNSSFSELSESDRAFEGLEESLHLLEILHCNFTSEWTWDQLSHLRRLVEIHVSNTDLLNVADGVTRLAHLDIVALAFQYNKISRLEDDVFSPFVDMHRIALDGNRIEILKRSMFPRPASQLKILGLSSNNLKVLPKDIFTDMPALKSLYLTGNPMTTIDETTFGPVWNQLNLFLFHATSLSCDCRISWLTRADNRNKFIHAVCQNPSQFKGRELYSVQASELWC